MITLDFTHTQEPTFETSGFDAGDTFVYNGYLYLIIEVGTCDVLVFNLSLEEVRYFPIDGPYRGERVDLKIQVLPRNSTGKEGT